MFEQMPFSEKYPMGLSDEQVSTGTELPLEEIQKMRE